MDAKHDKNPSVDSADTLKAGDMSSGKMVQPPAVNATKNINNCPGSGVIPVLVKEAKEVKVIPNGKSPNSESGLSVREGGDKFSSVFSSSAWRLLEIGLAETVGTGCLMFFGCMGLLGEKLPPLQGALVFGLVVCTIIQIFGHISAAHLNPVVTVAAIVLGKITPATAVIYFLAELVGAIVGFSLLKVVTPCELWKVSSGNGTGVCSTVPMESLTDAQSLALEFLATTFLILVVCSVWDGRNADKPDSVPLKFAVTITVISVTVGPLTGASMNPVRTLAPALVNGVWTKHWIYWVAPMSAGFLASVFYQLIFDRKQQLKSEVAEEVPLTGVLASDCKSVHSLRQSNNALNDKPNSESQTQ